MYGSEDQIIKSLFNLIIKKCGLEETERKELVKLLKQYYPLVSIVSPSVGKIAKASLNIIGETEKTDATVLKEEIDKLLQGTANPLTIYIDDVDRLNKDEVQMLFKTLRLIASFKHVIYVVSCDFEMVAKSIKENYANGLVQDGRSFIDKIIQIPIRIPEISSELLLNYGLDYIIKSVNIDLKENELFKTLFIHFLKTPRDVKRFANSFKFTYSYLEDRLLPVEDLITIELIKAKKSFQFNFIRIYYDSLKQGDAHSNFEKLKKKYLETHVPHFFKTDGELKSNIIELQLCIFSQLFNISWHSFQYIATPKSNQRFKTWKNFIKEGKQKSLHNPEVFQQSWN